MSIAVSLVRSYLEFCGYFVLAELPIRERYRTHYQDITDVDIVAVRFPHEPVAGSCKDLAPLDVFLGVDPHLGCFESGIDVLIGEVKEGQARLNRGLRRTETIEFALRRVGCCPEEDIADHARMILRNGHVKMEMPGGIPCRVRTIVFAGYGEAQDSGVKTVSLNTCEVFIRQRLSESRKILYGVQFRDSVLGLIALQEKLVSGSIEGQ